MSDPETKILLPIKQQTVGLSQEVVGPSCGEGPILYKHAYSRMGNT